MTAQSPFRTLTRCLTAATVAGVALGAAHTPAGADLPGRPTRPESGRLTDPRLPADRMGTPRPTSALPLEFVSGPEGDVNQFSRSRYRAFLFRARSGEGSIRFTFSSRENRFTTQRPTGMPTMGLPGAPGRSLTLDRVPNLPGAPRRKADGGPGPVAHEEDLLLYMDTGSSQFRTEKDFDLLTVTAQDGAGRRVTRQMRVHLTQLEGRPRLISLHAGEARFLDHPEVTYVGGHEDHRSLHFHFTAVNWLPGEPGAEVLVEHSDGFRYALPVQLVRHSRSQSGDLVSSYVGRYLRHNRSDQVQVRLVGPFGASEPMAARIWNGVFAQFPTSLLSPAMLQMPERRDNYNYGRDYVLKREGGVLPADGIESIPLSDFGIGTTSHRRLEDLPAGESAFLYQGARVMVTSELFGKVTILSQPAVGELVKPTDRIRVKWEHGPAGHVGYQVHIKGVFVDGIDPQQRR